MVVTRYTIEKPHTRDSSRVSPPGTIIFSKSDRVTKGRSSYQKLPASGGRTFNRTLPIDAIGVPPFPPLFTDRSSSIVPRERPPKRATCFPHLSAGCFRRHGCAACPRIDALRPKGAASPPVSFTLSLDRSPTRHCRRWIPILDASRGSRRAVPRRRNNRAGEQSWTERLLRRASPCSQPRDRTRGRKQSVEDDWPSLYLTIQVCQIACQGHLWPVFTTKSSDLFRPLFRDARHRRSTFSSSQLERRLLIIAFWEST